MAEKTTCRSEPTLYCRLHATETYQLYCKDCQDFVCFVCLGDFHEKHVFCRLQDVEEDIRNQFNILFSENDNCIKKIDEFRQIIDQNMTQLYEDEGEIEHQITMNVAKLKEQINSSEKYLLSGLKSMFKAHQLLSQELTTRVENIRSQVTKLNHVNVDKLPEYKLEEVIYVLSELKACSIGCEEIKKYQKPNFNTDLNYGNENFEVEVSETINMLSTMHFSVSTQTEDHDAYDSDTEDEWFDAEGSTNEDSIERSSDEIKGHNSLHVCKLNKELGRITKICPISHSDAWILADRQLHKMVNHTLDDTVYVDNADDILVLEEGFVLILRNNSRIIMKLLQNRRLVRFANIGTDDMVPFCFCISVDDTLTVCLISGSREQNGYRNSLVRMNKEGIVQVKFDLLSVWFSDDPYFMLQIQSNVCVLYKKWNELHYINLLKTANNKCEKIKKFIGIFGDDPSKHFECHGMCTDNNNLFVADMRHHSVCLLSKDLEYRKCVLNATHGLDKPTAVAILNDHLWIADGDQIFIAELNNIND